MWSANMLNLPINSKAVSLKFFKFLRKRDCKCYKGTLWDFPGGTGGKKSTQQGRRHKRHGFNPWDGKIPQRRTWQPRPVAMENAMEFLPGECLGQRSLVGYSPQGHKELDMIEATSHTHKSTLDLINEANCTNLDCGFKSLRFPSWTYSKFDHHHNYLMRENSLYECRI